MGTMKVTEKYSIDKELECNEVFKTADPAHPGVQKVMEQASREPGRPRQGALRIVLPGRI